MPTTGVMFWKIEVTLAPALCTPMFQNNNGHDAAKDDGIEEGSQSEGVSMTGANCPVTKP